MVATASAQVSYDDASYTSYQVVNLGNANTTINVTYYDENGNPASYSPSFPNVQQGGAVTVQQSMENALAPGRYSAVISASEPIAAIANQQLGSSGSGTSIAPFSSYTGSSSGATQVTLPAIMHNWFGYYTEIYIQNVGDGPAANVQITYDPTTVGTCLTGATGQTDTAASTSANLAQYATNVVSQLNKTSLGASGMTGGCATFNGRFLGGASITADQPVVVIVNQYVQDKLFTYNGFASSGTNLIAPAYMRNYFGYYASLTIANPGTTDANVTVTYTSDSLFSNPKNMEVVENFTIEGGKSINRYDGPGASADQTDLATEFPEAPGFRFFGSVKITSDVPVVAIVNQESVSASGNQAGSYNALLASEGSQMISAPLIQSDFYGYYTSLTIMTVDGTDATVQITYTSDGEFSSVKNTSKTYTMDTVNGFLNRYEGPTATADQSDILDDAAWVAGGQRLFIGSAVIEVVSGADIVAFVNSESNTAPNAASRDSLYSYNAFNMQP